MFGRDTLYPGEMVVYETRPRFILQSRSTLIKAIGIIIILYIFNPVVTTVGDLDTLLIMKYNFTLAEKVAWGLIGLLVIISLAILWDLFSWRNRRYVVTDQRVIVESGVLRKKRFYIHHNKIVDIIFSQGLVKRLFGAADIHIYGGHDETHIILENAPSPDRIEYSINRFIESRPLDEARQILRELSHKPRRELSFSDPEFWEPEDPGTDGVDEDLPEKSDESIMERHSRKFKKFRE